MHGDPPTDDFVLAYRLKKTLKEVTQMEEYERLGWDAFFTVHDVMADLAQATADHRR